MSRFRFVLAACLLLAFQAAFAKGLSMECIDDVLYILEEHELEDLAVTVAKVKAQEKAAGKIPIIGLFLGPGSDDKVTDIGLTIGCAKEFPDNPGDIKATLAEIAKSAAKNAAASAAKSLSANKSKNAKPKASESADEDADAEQSETYGRKANSSNLQSGPKLKECEDIFNSATHFCYDGIVYALCNGMKYDPTAYFCESPIIRIAKCGEKKYNPLKQGCCDNAIFELSNQRCQNNAVETKCGTRWHDFENLPNNRCNNDVFEAKCGTEWYDAADKNIRCQNNVFEAKCGNSWYNADEKECKAGNIVDASTECGGKKYNFKKMPNNRCSNGIFETKCGNGWYNATNPALRCKDNIIETRCGSGWYNATDANLKCQNNVVKMIKCGNKKFDSETRLCDDRDNRIYKYVKIGTQTWMAENLNYNAIDSKCYNCKTYGRLYDWTTAMSVCPTGWHLPSDNEWSVLHNYAGGINDLAGKYLKAGSGWNSGGDGEDKYGFAALPGGSVDTDGEFGGTGDFGIWWSSSESGNDNAYNRSMGFSHESTDWGTSHKSNLYNVRCVIGEVKEQRKR